MNAGCALCGGSELVVFVDRRAVPVHQNLPRDTPEAARAVTRGDLELACCRRCGFIGNLAFRDELLEYGEDYENEQTWSPHFAAHIDSLIDHLIAAGVHDQLVVEVGCGKATFLRKLCERGNNRGIGFDPSYVGDLVVDDGRVELIREFYGRDHRHLAPDAVICRHVIEHVASPPALLAAVAAGLDHPARLYFETPDVGWILRNVVVQDFFYEHCSYFTPRSLRHGFLQAGFRDPQVRPVFGDQYLWLEATFAPGVAPAAPAPEAGEVLAEALHYQRAVNERLGRLDATIARLRGEGPLALWGAGAKGVTFANLLDPAGERFDCVIDINPRKQGRFLPGTGHPIVGPDALAARAIANVLVMNGNYLPEIRETVTRAGLATRIHNEADL